MTTLGAPPGTNARMSASANPELANKILREVVEKPQQEPTITAPEDVEYRLCGGYHGPDGKWETTFEVRELTGRDEEYLGRLTNPMRAMIAVLERGLVRVGPHRASPAVLDGLLAGDWETVLLAIRVVTFGRTTEARTTCESCREGYVVDIDLIDQIRTFEVTEQEINFDVKGRHGTTYSVCLPYGSVQRRMMDRGEGLTNGEANTILLSECVLSINGMPPLGVETIRDIPLADRKAIVQEIDSRRVGPDLRGVKTKCPHCGAEQDSPLGIAALFPV